ncbi:MAG: hypothetical protein GVY06_01730 [Alphaproteobacteria bacterium]|jgi:hypothetical protein|nr:hypothetical protein [Alphaproteobacteria bacterium]
MGLASDLHVHFMQVPVPLGELGQEAGRLNPDLAGEYRAEPVHPETHAFMADIDPAFMEQVFAIAK